jgi:hypothetical protein
MLIKWQNVFLDFIYLRGGKRVWVENLHVCSFLYEFRDAESIEIGKLGWNDTFFRILRRRASYGVCVFFLRGDDPSAETSSAGASRGRPQLKHVSVSQCWNNERTPNNILIIQHPPGGRKWHFFSHTTQTRRQNGWEHLDLIIFSFSSRFIKKNRFTSGFRLSAL